MIAESRDKKLRKEARSISWRRVVAGVFLMMSSGLFFLAVVAEGIVIPLLRRRNAGSNRPTTIKFWPAVKQGAS